LRIPEGPEHQNEATRPRAAFFRRDPIALQSLPLKNLCAFGEFRQIHWKKTATGPGPTRWFLKLKRVEGRTKAETFDAELGQICWDSGGENEWLIYCRDISRKKEGGPGPAPQASRNTAACGKFAGRDCRLVQDPAGWSFANMAVGTGCWAS